MQDIIERLTRAVGNIIEGEDTRLEDTTPAQALARLQLIVRLASLATSVFVVATPLYQSQLGGSGTHLGITFALGELATALARPIVGRALDKYGRRAYVRMGVFFVFLGMVLMAFARPFSVGPQYAPLLSLGKDYALFMLDISRIVQGFGMGTMLLASYAITADLSRGGTGTSFGSTEQAQFRGGLYGWLMAVPIFLINGFNTDAELRITPAIWSTSFAIYAGGALLSFVMSYRGLPETKAFADAAHSDEIETPASIARSNRINPQLYVLMAIVLFTNFSDGLKLFILRFIQENITTDNVQIGLSYLPAALIWATLPSRMGVFADRYGRKLPMSIGLTASGLFSLTIPLLAVLLTNNKTIALILLTAFSGLEALCYSAAVPAEQALVADMMGGKKRGTGFGLYTLAVTGGRALGPLIMGALYDVSHSGPFIANAVILIVGAGLVWFALKDPGRPKHAFADAPHDAESAP
jgi:MFS transporter, DHA1 family, multidrug resistance protein